jgi:hypothetical protein
MQTLAANTGGISQWQGAGSKATVKDFLTVQQLNPL